MQDYKIVKLKNGLRLVMVPKSSTGVVTVLALLGVGSRSENDNIAGISHVLEHMHYKGTKKRPTGFKIAEFIESIGGEHNAFTAKEYTGYYVKLASKHLPEAFDFLSDILMNSRFDPVELEREKKVILEEINMYEDLPMEMVENKFELTVFGKNSLGRSVIGSKETVKAITRENLVGFRNKHYYAENAVIALAGNFGAYSDRELEALVLKYFNFPSGTHQEKEELVLSDKKDISIQNKKTEQSHLIVGFQTVPLDHPDYFKLELLSVILGGSMSSRMFEEVREKRGLAYAVRTHCINFLEGGAIFTHAGVPHSKIYEAIPAILNEYYKIKAAKVTLAELNKAKEIIGGKILIKFEDSEELANHYAFEALLMKKIMTPEQLLAAYQKITVDDIWNTANKYLVDEKMALSLIGSELNEIELNKIFKL